MAFVGRYPMVKEVITKYLTAFPTIRLLLGEWVESQITAQIKHPLIQYLQKGEPDWEKIGSVKKGPLDATAYIIIDYLQHHHNHLNNLERCLAILHGEQRLERFLTHLKQKETFWQGYAEIETTALFKQVFGEVMIEPHLPNCKYVEFTFSLGDVSIFVEVAAPKMGQKFEDVLTQYATTERKVVFVRLPDDRNRIKDAILQQFSHFNNIDVPALIVYNVNQCEFDGKDIAERFRGTSYLTVYINKDKRETMTRVERDSDSVILNDPDLVNLGGIICYKRNFDINGHVVYDTDLIGIRFSLDTLREIGRVFTEC